MKNLINLFLLLVPFVAVTAQKSMTEGYIKMEITDIKAESDDPNMAMGLEMMKGSVTEIYFIEGKYKTTMNMMGGMIAMQNVVDVSTKKMDMLFDAMGNKMWIDSNLDEVKESADQTNGMEDFDISYDKSETKSILGFEAYKATITIPNTPGTTVEGWITEEINTDANIIQGMADLKLKGFPLEFSVKNPQMTMTFAATDIKESVDKSVFDFNTTGYKKMTMKEFQETMGGMGALGF